MSWESREWNRRHLDFECPSPSLNAVSRDKKSGYNLVLGPRQTRNVWRPNTIKHCLVTKHANVEESDQTAKTCLIKHRWNNWYKPWANVVRMRASNIFDTRLSKRTKHRPSNTRTKEMFYVFDQMFDGLQILSNMTKYDQTRSNTIKQHQTRCPNGKMFGHQTMFDCVWSPNIYRLSRPFQSTNICTSLQIG